jgi:tetratricopeptide (TPR) repeat protein
MGKSFHQTFEVDSSVFYLTRALAIAEKLKDKSRIFNASGYLGSVFLTMGEPEKSIRYLNYALNNQTPTASKVMVRIRLLDLAEGLLKIKQFDKADSAMKAVEKINETLKDAWGRTVLNKLRGIYELQLKNYSQALFHLRSAYHDRSSLGNAYAVNPDIKNIVFHLGIAEYELHMYDSAILHLREAARLARQVIFLREEMYGYQLIGDAGFSIILFIKL